MPIVRKPVYSSTNPFVVRDSRNTMPDTTDMLFGFDPLTPVQDTQADPAVQPQTAVTPFQQVNPPLNKDQFLSQTDVPVPARPRTDFDRPNNPATGMPYTKDEWAQHVQENPQAADNTWFNRHPGLRRGLAYALSGVAEYAGELNGQYGQGGKLLDRWNDQWDKQREYDQNLPALRYGARQQAYEDYAKNYENLARGNYYANMGNQFGKGLDKGYQFNPTTGNYEPIGFGNMSALQQGQVGKTQADIAKAGFRPDGKGGVVPMTQQEMSLMQGADLELKQAQAEYQKASADLQYAKNDANSDYYQTLVWKAQMAWSRLNLAANSYNLSLRRYMGDNYGTDPMSGAAPLMGAPNVPFVSSGVRTAGNGPSAPAATKPPVIPGAPVVPGSLGVQSTPVPNNGVPTAHAAGAGTPLPGAMVGPDGQPVGQKNAKNLTPPETMRNMAAYARTVRPHIDIINSDLDKLAQSDKLGPLAGRWSDFVYKNWGGDEPLYAKLRTDLGMAQTAMMKAHSGSGNNMILDHFMELLNAKTMTPENLRAVLGSLDEWMKQYQDAGTIPTTSGTYPAPYPNQPAPSNTQGGALPQGWTRPKGK